MNLKSLGWNDQLRRAYEEHDAPDRAAGRVVRVDRGRATVRTASAEVTARWSGQMQHASLDPSDLPVVGDWVVVSTDHRPGNTTIVHARLPRRTQFTRQMAGRTSSCQVLAANLDIVLIVCGLDGDFNPRRIERYVALTLAGGVDPIVVLNKTDLCDGTTTRMAEVRSVAPGVAVVALAASTGERLEALEALLAPGMTVALVGSSGAGKSTLLNRLSGDERAPVGEVRASDDRGRHTTTRRELFVLPSGVLCIDTPGLRELQLSVSVSDVDAAFPEIERLAAGCRFRDCTHGSEPGCAVRVAVDNGTLDPGRRESWERLQREAAHHERRKSERVARAEARKVGRMYRRIQNEKRGRRR